MKQFKVLVPGCLIITAILSVSTTSPVLAVVTYDGDNGVYNNIFNSNSVQSCTSCHHSTIPYDDGGSYIYGEKRHYAPDAVDFDTYAATQLLNPYYADGTTVAEGAYRRVVEHATYGVMPMTPNPDINTYGTYPDVSAGLSISEQSLMNGWKNDGYLRRAAPETNTWHTATSLGKYAGTIWTQHKQNGVNTWLSIRYDNDTNMASEYIAQTGFGYTGSGGSDVYSGWQSYALTNLSCGTTYYMQGWSYNNVYGWTSDVSVESFTTVACPAISTASLPAAQESVAYSTSVSSTNSGPVATYSLTVAPAAMTINPSTGEINWTPPDAAMNYSESVTVQVSDGTTAGSRNFTLDVAANSDPPVITEGTGIKNTMPENTNYDFVLSATDVDFNSLTWTESLAASNGSVTITPITPVGLADSSVSVRYTPTFNYYGGDSFEIKVTDGNGGFDVIQIQLDITSDDFDHDSVLNGTDNCQLTANTDQTNTDGDSQGDACDDDDDNDGMPDTFETDNGLNPLVDDSAADADGDGVNNLDEYINGTDVNQDHVPPVVTPPANIVVNASGHLTQVDLGTASAFDYKDGVLSATASKSGTFESGRHTITWSATDLSLNTGSANQTVDVIPQINFSVNQAAGEGATVAVSYELSGDAAEYPVSFDYVVSGTADSNDSDAVSGSAIINSGRSGSINVNVIDDANIEGNESIIITMTTINNAIAGEKTEHRIDIVESNIAPMVSLAISQSAENRTTVYQDQGQVTVTAVASDANPGDVLSYDWAASDTAVKDVNANGLSSSSFIFDPTTLATGAHRVDVGVNDATEITQVSRLFIVEATAPVLTTADSDGDGITDDVEGVEDSDGDGIADYLDAVSQQNAIQNQTGNLDNQVLIQTEAGLQIMLGQFAVSAARKGVSIIEDDILLTTGETTLPGVELNGQTNIYDFEIHGISPSQGALGIVLPLQAAMQSGVNFYVYDQQTGWQVFVENNDNRLSSSNINASDYCPVVNDAIYTESLTLLDLCVQLHVTDGGPNDADGEINGVVRITGVVAYSTDAGANDDPEPAEIGMLHPLTLFLLALMLGLLRRRVV